MLVMVLVLIAIASLSMAGLARQSLRAAAEAADAQQRFERHWSTLTLQRALLADAESLLEQEALKTQGEQIVWPLIRRIEGSFQIGQWTYEFVLADEDAKVNLNRVLREDPNSYQTVVMSLLQSSGQSSLVPAPPPLPGQPSERTLTPFQSWGQVFVPRNGGQRESLARGIQLATREMTCWGSGRLNVRRASENSIRTLCRMAVTPPTIDKLLEERTSADLTGLEDLIGRLDLKAGERFAFQRLLTDESNCFTLWLTVSDGKREWTQLTVSPSARGNPSTWQSFRW